MNSFSPEYIVIFFEKLFETLNPSFSTIIVACSSTDGDLLSVCSGIAAYHAALLEIIDHDKVNCFSFSTDQ